MEPAEEQADSGLPMRQIGRILSESHDPSERKKARQALLPLFWDAWPTRRYAACCLLTTRIYLPFGAHLLEFMSFPYKFGKELRKRNAAVISEASLQEMNDAVTDTLKQMLDDWIADLRASRGVGGRQKQQPSMDIGADIAEAVGRMGIIEAEKDLLGLLFQFSHENNEVRLSTLMALALFPPEQLSLFWKRLREGPVPERQIILAAVYYMTNPAAVPFLLDTLENQAGAQSPDVIAKLSQPIVRQLGIIGDPRALNTLIVLAREGPAALRPTAQAAIRRLMKEAEGQEEVTLLRASSASASDGSALLRASHPAAQDSGFDTLLRAADDSESKVP